MKGKMGRGRPRQKLIDRTMEDGNSRKKHKIDKSGVVGRLDLSRGRQPEDEDDNTVRILMTQALHCNPKVTATPLFGVVVLGGTCIFNLMVVWSQDKNHPNKQHSILHISQLSLWQYTLNEVNVELSQTKTKIVQAYFAITRAFQQIKTQIKTHLSCVINGLKS